MPTIAEQMEELEEAGFTYQEIIKWKNQKAFELKKAGFTDKEIFKELGYKKPPYEEPVRNYWEVVKDSMVGEKFEIEPYFRKGLSDSTVNMAYRRITNQPLAESLSKALPEDTGHLERILYKMSGLFADSPIYAVGAAIGAGTTGGNPFGIGFGTAFVPAALREALLLAYENDEAVNPKIFSEMIMAHGLDVFWKASKEGAALGTGFALPGILNVQKLLPKSATQAGGLLSMQSLLEGRLPSKEELIDTPVLFFAGNVLAKGFAKKNKEIFLETGKKPSEVIIDAMANPKIKENYASENILGSAVYGIKRKIKEMLPKFKKTPVENLVKDPDMKKVAKTIEFEPAKETNKIFNINEWFASIKTRWIDKTQPFVEIVKRLEKAKKEKKITIEKDGPIEWFVHKGKRFWSKEKGYQPVNLAEKLRLTPGQIGKGQTFIDYFTFDFNTAKKGKALKAILEPLIIKDKKGKVIQNISEKNLAEFSIYLKSKRAVEIATKEKETGVDLQAAKNVVKKYESKYGKIQREIVEYQNTLLRYMKDADLISEKNFKVLLETSKDYVPFYRVIEAKVGLEGTYKSKGFGGEVYNPIKFLKGSKKKTFDPLEAIHKNTYLYLQLAERNSALKYFIDSVKLYPELIPEVYKVDAKTKPIDLPKKELERIVSNKKFLTKEAAEGFTIFRKEGQVVSNTEIAIYRNGKREVWEVGSEIAFATKHIQLQDSKFMNSMLRVMAKPASWLRAGATLAPDFFIKNIIRDTMQSPVFAKSGIHLPFINTYKGLSMVLSGKFGLEGLPNFKQYKIQKKQGFKIYQDWTRSGALQSMMVSMDRTFFNLTLKKELTSRPVHNLIKNPIETLRVFSELAETATRLGEFKRVYESSRKAGMTKKQALERAGFEGRDITIDFSKMGAYVRPINMIAAFWNARIQGYTKIGEAFARRPGRTMTMISASIILPSVLLWLRNNDSETYRELPQWQKDLFWIVITNEGLENEIVWRIPKPFELGILFGTGTERFLDWASKRTDGKQGIRILKEQVYSAASLLSPMPEFLAPFMEKYANKSFFTGRPIIPRRLERIFPYAQYSEYTSETSKVLGKLLTYAGGKEFSYAAPLQIDNLINRWTGTLGRYATRVLDQALMKSGIIDVPIKPKSDIWVKNLRDMPIIRAFIVRHPSMGSQYITEFYNKYELVQKQLATKGFFEKSGDYKHVLKEIEELDKDLLHLVEIAPLLSKLNGHVRKIYAMPKEVYSANEKREQIDMLYEQMIFAAKEGLLLHRRLKNKEIQIQKIKKQEQKLKKQKLKELKKKKELDLHSLKKTKQLEMPSIT